MCNQNAFTIISHADYDDNCLLVMLFIILIRSFKFQVSQWFKFQIARVVYCVIYLKQIDNKF